MFCLFIKLTLSYVSLCLPRIRCSRTIIDWGSRLIAVPCKRVDLKKLNTNTRNEMKIKHSTCTNTNDKPKQVLQRLCGFDSHIDLSATLLTPGPRVREHRYPIREGLQCNVINLKSFAGVALHRNRKAAPGESKTRIYCSNSVKDMAARRITATPKTPTDTTHP